MPQHKYVVHKDCKLNSCIICDGGLALCEVCGLGEGALTTECCGHRVDSDVADDCYIGKQDFINNIWVYKP